MAETNKFRISKKFAFQYSTQDYEESMQLLEDQTQVDCINVSFTKRSRWYLVGENGYYIVKSLSGEMMTYQNLDTMPKKYRRRFIEFDRLEEDS